MHLENTHILFEGRFQFGVIGTHNMVSPVWMLMWEYDQVRQCHSVFKWKGNFFLVQLYTEKLILV